MTPLTDPAYLDALWEVATPEERDEIRRLLDNDLSHHIWRAQVGRQSEAADSLAFVTGYGGSAGGGKSDLICGLSLTDHQRSAIFRREKTQTEGIIQRLTEVLGSTDGYNSQKSSWRTTVANVPRLIEFAGLDGPSDHQKWQGRPHDGKFYDEVTEQREHQVRFTMGWTRSSDPNQRCRVLMTFNPPTTAEGRWVISYFGPWLDDKHPNPAKPGELRWFTTIKGADVECADDRPFVIFRGEPLYDFDPSEFSPEKIIRPRSRTFIPSRVTDNYFYVRSGYIETLQSLPEPLRSQMLEGDFLAGVEDDPWQVIPTAWIDDAMARWQPREAKGVMDSLGADIAAGGKDNMVVYARHGTWFDLPITIPGREIPQERAGPIAAGHIITNRRDRAVAHVDVIGWGLACCNFLTANEIQHVAVNFANGSNERTADGSLGFHNMRAQVIWRMRETLDPTNPNPAAIPNLPRLRADLASYRWQLRPTGIFIMPKEEQKLKLGHSPDDGDAICLANMATMKQAVFEEMVAQANDYDRYGELP
ncbi:terminase [Sphingopyxis sp. FD7]|uniref:terminase n=1 Tax=Sphingopyxis sp. FD7 TaxID=1914525 RepID=UPI000DC62E2B|nr:terminase [Sphingopyxis sp. FD7]BBB13643.1 phage terminase large subunit [Sphingopyxis sp. FD7]